MSKFLLVDDDVELGLRLKDYFLQKSINLEIAVSGEDAIQLLTAFDFDLILLDWMLPGVTGLDLCRYYRNHGGQTHIIFLTGEGDIDNKEKALQSGGDDYIVKPFDLRELSARIGSVLRRSINIINEAITIRGVTLDTQNRTLTTPLTALKLTPKEAMMMEYLMRHRNRPFSAGKLLSAIWPSETDVSVGTVRTAMHNLRQKLASAGQEFFIKSIANSGYVIED